MIHVSIVTLPDVVASSLMGPYDVLTYFNRLSGGEDTFRVELVGPTRETMTTSNGMPLTPHRAIADVPRTDIVYIPSLDFDPSGWRTGRHEALVDWMRAQFARGARLCGACTGTLLLAETGLLAAREATIHWAAERTFRDCFPDVALKLDQVLIATGPEGRLMMSGASGAWHDLILYLLTREVGPGAAQMIAKFFLLQWHPDGQAAYMRFQEHLMHGDRPVRAAQGSMGRNFTRPGAVDEAMRESGLAERTFKRRFAKATGYTPIAYVQNLRIEEAKRRLEEGDLPVDEISWAVGYEDPAFFRRLFKRMTGITPSAYRRKFRMPPVYLPARQSA